MIKILILDNRSEIALLLKINFKVYTNAESDLIKNYNEFEDVMRRGVRYDLLVVKSSIFGENIIDKVTNYLLISKIEIPIYAMGKAINDNQLLHFIEEFPDLKKILKSLACDFKITPCYLAELKLPKYFPFPVECISLLEQSNCDVFYKENEEFYLLLKQRVNVGADMLKKIMGHNIEDVFVSSKNRVKFVNSVSSYLLSKLNTSKTSKDEKQKIVSISYEFISERFSEIDVDPELSNLITSSVECLIELTHFTSKTLHDLLYDLLKNQSSYRFKHSQLIALFANLIVDQMEWGSKEQKKCLAFAAFFHDIFLKNDKFAKIHSKEEMKQMKLGPEESKIVLNHAALAATHFSQIPHMPMGVDKIILQHHGTNNGVGFSEVPFKEMAPLSKIFLIAEELSSYVLYSIETNNKIEFSSVLYKIQRKFSSSGFRDIISALGEISFIKHR